MLKYTIKRLISAIPTILVVSVLIFVLVRFIPGSPAQVMLPDDATPEEVAALEAQMGLDQPVPVQFVKWIGVTSLGITIYPHRTPVKPAVFEKLRNSMATFLAPFIS